MSRVHIVIASMLAVFFSMGSIDAARASGTYQVPDANLIFQANPQASGAKIFGKLSIFYTLVNPVGCPLSTPLVDMHISMVAWQGNTSNSHTAGRIVRNQCYFDVNQQKAAVTNVVTQNLLPLFQYSSFELKDARDLLQDEANAGTDLSPWFLMVDFTLAAR